MPKKWSLTTPSSPEDVACIFAADFVAVCKADGDMLNAYRWNSVLAELRFLRNAYDAARSIGRNSGEVSCDGRPVDGRPGDLSQDVLPA